MTKPQILKAGEPECVHYEYVDVDLIGVCRKCGQVRNYWNIYLDPIVEQLQASREKAQETHKPKQWAKRKPRRVTTW